MNRRLTFTASIGLGLALLLAPLSLRAAERRGFRPDDLYQLQAVTDPRLSPDGKMVAFVVTSIDRKQNRRPSTIWMAATDGTTPAVPFTTAQSIDQAKNAGFQVFRGQAVYMLNLDRTIVGISC